ncbi:hypothetical protein AMAG_01417 [Allomyces macrogynus ATCC 38327]|uniref:Uncharacterized protein n=1 Tax=Allomyces macrogynus (strain ATCC 38327) TaxID=578462 RepID=A0A0L0RZG0_ALLM3|nr:hypothetical protein AMAG_01417 [Allomyces macrogynus ATCC 38327]|eukprot:KNE55530.1 hypothetical protein AMAG_01417 [Allomyces macrogynus ATCC 38327]
MAPLRRSLQLPHPVVSCGDPRTAATLPNPLAPHGAAVGAATAGPLTVTIVRTRTLAAVPALRAGPQTLKGSRGGDRSQLAAAAATMATRGHAPEHHFVVPSLYHGEPLSLVVSCHASAQSAALAIVVTAPVPLSAGTSSGAVDRDGDVPMELARGQPVPLCAVRRRGEIGAEHGPASSLLGACVDTVTVASNGAGMDARSGWVQAPADDDADRTRASVAAAAPGGSTGSVGEQAGDTHALSFPAAEAAGVAARHVCGPPMALTAAAEQASYALIQVDLVQPGDGDSAAAVASVVLHFRPLLFLAEKLHAQAVPAAAALGTAVADRDPDAALAIVRSHLLAAAQLAAWPILARPNLALLASIDPVTDPDLDLAAAIDAKMAVPNVYCVCSVGQATATAVRGNLQALAHNDNRALRDPAVIGWPGLPSPSHKTIVRPRGTQPAISCNPSGGRAAPGLGALTHVAPAPPMVYLPPTPPSIDLAATSRRRVASRAAAPAANIPSANPTPIDTHQRTGALPMAQTLDRYRRTGALEFILPSPLPSPTSSGSSSPVTVTTTRGVARREPTAVVPPRPTEETVPNRITSSPSLIGSANATVPPTLCPCPDCAQPNERARWTRHDRGTDSALKQDRTATKRAAMPCACPECATASLPPAKRLAVAHLPATHRDAPQVVLPSVSEWFDKRPLSPLLQPCLPLPVTTLQKTQCSVPGCTECGMSDTSAMRPTRPAPFTGTSGLTATRCSSDYMPSIHRPITMDRAAAIAPMPPPRWHAPRRPEHVAESRVPLPAAARIRYC